MGAEHKMASQIKLRRDTAANWTAANPVLGAGEPGYDTTNSKLKIGNGTTAWTSLPYFDDKVTDFSAVATNVLPDADNTRDLGSPTKQWRHVYTAGGSIYLDNIKLTNVDGKFVATKVINPGQINEAPDPIDSDAGSEIGSGADIGSLKISGSTIGTVDESDPTGWGDYDLVLNPGGESAASIYIPSVGNQGEGYPLQISNTQDSTSIIQLFGRGGVQLVTNTGEGQEVFDFGDDGKLRLPVGGDILNANGDSVLGSESGLPTVTIPEEQGSTYKGLQVSYGVVHSNSSTSELNVNKIVIHKPAPTTTEIDPTSNQDYFRVSGLGDSDVLAMFVIFGDVNGPKPLSDLQAFAEAAIDNVILDGGVEGQYNTVADMKAAFYTNYATLASAADGLDLDFEFYQTYVPTTTGTTTVRQGSGATFSVTVAIPGEPYATASQFAFGTNYRVGHKVKLSGADIGGTTPENDVTITVTSVDGDGGITGVSFEGTSNVGASPGTIYNGISGTNFNVGSGFNVLGISQLVDGSYSSLNLSALGSQYVVGDVLTLLGANLTNGTSPANDITITIQTVDGSGVPSDWSVSGTIPRVWPENSISDGGNDQYDTANYINSFYTTNIGYNQGNTVADGTAVFGAGSSYSFVYDTGIFGLLVTGNQSTFIETSGNSGADGSSTTEAGNIYGPDIAAQTFDNAVTHINLIGDPWAGPIITFVRPDNSDETIDILIADDGNGAGVAIARSSNGNGIFNPYREEGWSNNTSPAGTLWNTDGWNDLSNVTTRIYDNLYAAFGSGGLGNKIVGTECVMYLPDNGKYYAVKFDAWTQNNNGGGFAYTRREIDLDNLQEGIRFSDGTRLKSAEGIGRVKLESPGDRKIEEVYGYKSVTLTPIATTDITTTASRAGSNTFDVWIDSTATTIDDVVDNPANYGNAYGFEFSLDNNTWYSWTGSTGFDGNERAYSINPTLVTYNQGDTIYFRYKTGGTPVVWWDRTELPGGGGNFRGAVIDYHAYTGESTIIGTIHIVRDSGEEHISHQEVQSGSSDGENDDLWVVDQEGQIKYRRIDGEGKTLKVQWSARVFYGSEFYD